MLVCAYVRASARVCVCVCYEVLSYITLLYNYYDMFIYVRLGRCYKVDDTQLPQQQRGRASVECIRCLQQLESLFSEHAVDSRN